MRAATGLRAVAVMLMLAGGLAVEVREGRGRGAPPPPGPCDRPCLEGFIHQYLDALVAHNAFDLPLAQKVKFSERLVDFTTAKTDYKIYIADPQGGAAGFIGVIHDHNVPGQLEKPTILALRLKIVNRQITEAEAVTVRGVNANNLANLKTPRPSIMETLPVSERRSREELIKVTNLYFDGIEQSTGAIVPFDDECNRLENGMRTAGPPLPGARLRKRERRHAALRGRV